mmetsp:Transcript_16921/g.42724  ORF Transcript_16921/g.42724 Transcript_16921/m.42724 type:complete len:276 (-) Transcript_16921:148-975(-)
MSASSAGKRSACVFTIVREEPVFLPIWYRYYSAHFGDEDIYVLHHVVPSAAEKDECTSTLRCHVVEVANDFFDPDWLRSVVSEHQTALLQKYEAVLFTEVDEIVLPDTSRPFAGGAHARDLKSYLEAFGSRQFASGEQPAVRCLGWEMHHDFSTESAVDLGRPLLSQRRVWHRNELYDKALLTRVPLHYSLGFHTCEEETPRDESLLLLHLHKYDFQAYMRRHEDRAAMKHSEQSITNGWNRHYRVTGPQLLAQYLQTPAPTEPIPAWLRELEVV